jgi:hypothetical protein
MAKQKDMKLTNLISLSNLIKERLNWRKYTCIGCRNSRHTAGAASFKEDPRSMKKHMFCAYNLAYLH